LKSISSTVNDQRIGTAGFTNRGFLSRMMKRRRPGPASALGPGDPDGQSGKNTLRAAFVSLCGVLQRRLRRPHSLGIGHNR